jgi:hypothetical protein
MNRSRRRVPDVCKQCIGCEHFLAKSLRGRFSTVRRPNGRTSREAHLHQIANLSQYHKLGVPWASSLLGFLAVAMVPIPFLFLKYGAAIRAKSRFTPKF